MNKCHRLCGEMRLSIPARFTNRLTIRSAQGRSPGTKAARCPSTTSSPSTPESTSTSAIRTHPGSAAATRTPTACCAKMPKSTDLSVHSEADLDTIAYKLNNRPRQTLGWMKPAHALAKLVAPID